MHEMQIFNVVLSNPRQIIIWLFNGKNWLFLALKMLNPIVLFQNKVILHVDWWSLDEHRPWYKDFIE